MRTLAGAMLVCVLIAGCSGASSVDSALGSPIASLPSTTPAAPEGSPEPSAVPSGEPTTEPEPAPQVAADAVIRPVGAKQWAAIVKAGVWRKGCPVGRDQLLRVEVNHHDFDGEVRRGVLIVNADVADSVARIFTALFDAEFPIRKMLPMESYGGDDDVAMLDDDTSAFNCRKPAQANAPPDKSPHANGRAIDVNPFENPWIDPRCDCWNPDSRFATKPRKGPGVITKGSVAWRAFTDEGWIWQDIKTPDYMHFDTGYPSAPLPKS